MNWYLVSVASLFMLIFVVGCGTSESSVQPPIPSTPISKPAPIVTNQVDSVSSQDAQNDSLEGEEIFSGLGGCGACHTIEGLTTGGVGPELTHIGTDATSRKAGLSASEYIEESIRSPEAFVPEGVERAMPGLMTSGITAHLTDGQIEALVKFLVSKK